MDMASAIVNNARGFSGNDDFSSKLEKALLLACILFAADENNSTIGSSISDIYNYLSTHTIKQLDIDMEKLPSKHLAENPYRIFASSGDNAQNMCFQNLIKDLQDYSI